MTPLDYEFIRKMLKERSGLALNGDKKYLVESRLLPVARKAAVEGVAGLVARLRIDKDGPLAAEVVEAMATNETFFFRDKAPFDHFQLSVMPALLAARAVRHRIRIWCVGCSTGQEAYSLAMTLQEMGSALSGWRVEIIATDLSREVLDRARAGLYSQFEVQRGLPIKLLIKYFTQVGEQWQISPVVRAMVRYQQLNVLDDFSRIGQFDLIFCRNLLIYLDQDTKRDVLERLARVVDPSGYLVLGAAETVVGLTTAWRPHADSRGLFVPARPGVPAGRYPALAGSRA